MMWRRIYTGVVLCMRAILLAGSGLLKVCPVAGYASFWWINVYIRGARMRERWLDILSWHLNAIGGIGCGYIDGWEGAGMETFLKPIYWLCLSRLA